PFPAIKGAFGAPTIVNNVETICQVPHILNRGAEWFAGLGTKTQGGTRMYSVSGRVARPAVYEAPVSITLRQLIYERAGGVTGHGQLKAVATGGASGGRPARHALSEAPVSITRRQLIYERAGGVTGNGKLKAVVPGGSSAAILAAHEI